MTEDCINDAPDAATDFPKAWNAFRFATTAKKNNHEGKVFLMGEAVECEGLVHDKYNVDEQLRNFIAAGGEVLACETCLKMVEWSERMITF